MSEHKTSDHLYLDKLEFNPELRKSWLNFFIVNFRVVVLLIALVTMWGLYSFLSLPRESNPEVKIPMAIVMSTYPGASPSDIEELVTKKIETAISGVKDVDKITSKSYNSVSSVTVEFDAKADLQDSLRNLRDKMKDVEKDLPDDANEPVVSEISLDDYPIFTVSISSPYDGQYTRDVAEDIKDEIEKLPGVREVDVSGGDQTEFEVAYDPQKLTLFNISAAQANQKIVGANMVIPAGTFEGSQYSYPVKADGRFFDAKTLADLPISHTTDGAVIVLKDIASVSEKAIEKTTYARISSEGSMPSDAVTIQIIKKTGGNIIETVGAAKEIISSSLPQGFKYDIVVDYADEIDQSFSQLEHDFILTLILVFGLLFLIVGFKEALVAGLAIPLVFFVTFGVMTMTGISLNFLSLFSLILALGLLVDDAIVVVSATKQYLNTGKFTPEEAVLLVLNDFKVVLTTTTLTTVWAFLPLLMASGIMGEYLKSIPITVSVTLISSLIIALVINHPLAAILERIRFTRKLFSFYVFSLTVAIIGLMAVASLVPFMLAVLLAIVLFLSIMWYRRGGKAYLQANTELTHLEWRDDEAIKRKLRLQGSQHDANFGQRLMHGIIHFNAILPYYEKALRKILSSRANRWKAIGVVGMMFAIAVALPATGIVQSEFFPNADYEFVTMNIEAPSGLNLDETDKITRQAEEKLLKYKEIDNFSTIVGSGASNKASVSIKLKKEDDRDIKSYDLADIIRADMADIKSANITVESPKGGPPAGAAFEVQIKGDDLQELDAIAKDLKVSLDTVPGVIASEISLKDSPADYTFTLDHNRLELYNLNTAYVGSMLRMAISGTEVTTVVRNGDETKVMARFAKDRIPSLEAVQNIQILNTANQPVFLKDVAKIELKPSVEAIDRIDQERVVILSSDVSADTNAQLVLQQFQKKISGYDIPTGYEISYGGENEQNEESVMSIINAMAVSALLIISTLIIQFNSFKKAGIVLVTIPLALIGVFFGLAISGINLTFPGLIGILALFGIVVKNAIILVDKITLNIKTGIPFKESIIDAGKSRLEAIFITSICTILGIIPITLSNETWMALGGAIIFGLMLSSFLTLFVVPTLFATFIKDDPWHRHQEG
jgi:HAE1 family hydrophobic/amphiphilic exporter-1